MPGDTNMLRAVKMTIDKYKHPGPEMDCPCHDLGGVFSNFLKGIERIKDA